MRNVDPARLRQAIFSQPQPSFILLDFLTFLLRGCPSPPPVRGSVWGQAGLKLPYNAVSFF
ncbi:hypothetical protein E2C01_100217 [Portunus trituberculatus]|uniref:Uncharacterized protein n=1 Tax=Portunus trituberculatus TaxID=210409 RepID=A0A5B7K7G4_PORTR|nr:hypothetical protein [Portunus trituberculatus]